MLLIFRERRQVDQDIVNIRGNKYIKEFIKYIINVLLKYTRTIFYTK
jgi:hypothetical protein